MLIDKSMTVCSRTGSNLTVRQLVQKLKALDRQPQEGETLIVRTTLTIVNMSLDKCCRSLLHRKDAKLGKFLEHE